MGKDPALAREHESGGSRASDLASAISTVHRYVASVSASSTKGAHVSCHMTNDILIGLAVCRRLVQGRMQGHLRDQSRVYQEAREEASAAGFANLPFSPISLADRSDDGQ